MYNITQDRVASIINTLPVWYQVLIKQQLNLLPLLQLFTTDCYFLLQMRSSALELNDNGMQMSIFLGTAPHHHYYFCNCLLAFFSAPASRVDCIA